MGTGGGYVVFSKQTKAWAGSEGDARGGTPGVSAAALRGAAAAPLGWGRRGRRGVPGLPCAARGPPAWCPTRGRDWRARATRSLRSARGGHKGCGGPVMEGLAGLLIASPREWCVRAPSLVGWLAKLVRFGFVAG